MDVSLNEGQPSLTSWQYYLEWYKRCVRYRASGQGHINCKRPDKPPVSSAEALRDFNARKAARKAAKQTPVRRRGGAHLITPTDVIPSSATLLKGCSQLEGIAKTATSALSRRERNRLLESEGTVQSANTRSRSRGRGATAAVAKNPSSSDFRGSLARLAGTGSPAASTAGRTTMQSTPGSSGRRTNAMMAPAPAAGRRRQRKAQQRRRRRRARQMRVRGGICDGVHHLRPGA